VFARARVVSDLGGAASLVFRARIIRQLFPYKPWPMSKGKSKATSTAPGSDADEDDDDEVIEVPSPAGLVPANGNISIAERDFTATEARKLEEELKSHSLYYIDMSSGGFRIVRSVQCQRRVMAPQSRHAAAPCSSCSELGRSNESLKRGVRRVSICDDPLLNSYSRPASGKAKGDRIRHHDPRAASCG
jgi:hypothetical protein